MCLLVSLVFVRAVFTWIREWFVIVFVVSCVLNYLCVSVFACLFKCVCVFCFCLMVWCCLVCVCLLLMIVCFICNLFCEMYNMCLMVV